MTGELEFIARDPRDAPEAAGGYAQGLSVCGASEVTTYLSSREFAATNSAVRQELLGDHRVALTVVVTKIFDPVWLLEIEAIAAA